MTTLLTVLGLFQDAVAGLSGVKFAPEYPPENPEDFPFMVVYPGSFTIVMNSSEDYRSLYSIIVELHIARVDMPDDVAKALPYADTVPAALFGVCLNNVLANAGITGTFGLLGWGEHKETIGFQWTIRDVKILTTMP